jgi:hypothetical protein
MHLALLQMHNILSSFINIFIQGKTLVAAHVANDVGVAKENKYLMIISF